MTEQEIKGILENQLQLLSEYSRREEISAKELTALAQTMLAYASYLLPRFSSVI